MKNLVFKPVTLAIMALVLGCITLPHRVHAQCDPGIEPDNNQALQYKDRGNRCEGMYRAKVSSTTLRLVQFTKGAFLYGSEQDEVITLSTPVVAIPSVRVRATGIPRDLYYRMDGALDRGSTLQWQVRDVLRRNTRTKYPYNVGIYGYLGDDPIPDAYVPIRAVSNKKDATAIGTSYLVKLVATARLKNVKWRLRGETNYQLLNEGESYYPGRAITITLPSNLKPGAYTLEVCATEHGAANAQKDCTLQRRYTIRL